MVKQVPNTVPYVYGRSFKLQFPYYLDNLILFPKEIISIFRKKMFLEIGIKLEPDMVQKRYWSLSMQQEITNQIHVIRLLYYVWFECYSNFCLKIGRAAGMGCPPRPSMSSEGKTLLVTLLVLEKCSKKSPSMPS